MEPIKCLCGSSYTLVPDDEITGVPPSYMARQYYCPACNLYEWLEPYDFGALSWDELQDENDDTSFIIDE